MHFTLAEKSRKICDPSRLQTSRILEIAGVCLRSSWPTIHPWIPVGAAAKQETALRKQPSATATLCRLVCMQSQFLELRFSAHLQFTCEFTTSKQINKGCCCCTSVGQITSQVMASDRFSAVAAPSPPPRCVAQRVGPPQSRRSLSLSSTVSPTK